MQISRKKRKFLLLKTILSALLFSLSFIFINSLGFFVIPSFILLFFLFKEEISLKYVFIYGISWGIIAFGLYFIWLYELLLYKSGASFYLATALYLFIAFYSSILSGAFFVGLKQLFNFFYRIIFIEIIIFSFSNYLFFFLIERYYLFFLGRGTRYPFLNPIIPLAKYKLFLLLYSLFFSKNITISNNTREELFSNSKIIYLEPVIKSFNNNFNVITAGQLVYHQLANLNLNQYLDTYKRIILLAPETFFPYPLNKNQNIVKLWKNVLPAKSYFFLGSQRALLKKSGLDNKIFQTIFLLKGGRIIDFYDKKHRMAFAENIPPQYKNMEWSHSLFLHKKKKFSLGKQLNKTFCIENNIHILPKVCSEFFCGKELKNIENIDVIFLFINDSWFMTYFKNIMQNFVNLYIYKFNIPIFYISHSKSK